MTRVRVTRLLGVVAQNIFLVDDAIRCNVTLGIPEGDIAEEAVDEAVLFTHLSPFMDSLP